MSFRGGYRGGRGGGGGGRRDDSFRGRGGGGGFKSKFGGSKFDKPSFSKGRDRFGGGRPDRGNDFRRSRQDDFRGDSGFRGSPPRRFRGDSGLNGGDRERSFKDFSPRGDSFDRGNRLDFPSRKSRGGRASFRSAPPPSRSSRGGLHRDSGFTTKSGFISKKKDFPRKFVRGSSKREYFGRLKSIRYRTKYEDDVDAKHLSDDELRDEEEEDMEMWEYLGGEEAVDEEEVMEEDDEDHEEIISKDDEDEQTSDKKSKDASDKQEHDASDKKKTTQKKKVSSSDTKKKESMTGEEDKKSGKSSEGTKPDSTKDTSVSPDGTATSDSKGKTVKKVIKKVVKVTKKPSSESIAKSDKEKEKKDKTSDGKADKDETSSDDGETLKCPHCHFESCHVRVYLSHLKSKSHLLVMDKLLTAWKYKIQGIRMKQRKKQVFLDREARMLNLATFNCFICKLNYKTLKSEHLSSQPHRLLKKLLMPQCRICNLNFKSPGLYDAHICYIGHLRKKAKLEAELGTEMPNENLDLLDDDDDELDPGDFMVVDAAESGDDCAEEVENDDEKSPKAKKSKTLINIGAEMCKKVEVYYCEVCAIHLTRPLGKIEEALTYHCRHPKHLERFYRHRHRMNKRLEEEHSKEKESGEKEAKDVEAKTKKSVTDDDNKDDVSLNSPIDAHIIEGEDEEEHIDDEEDHYDDEEEQVQDFDEGDDEIIQDEEDEDHHGQEDDEIEEDIGEDEAVEEEDTKFKEANSDLRDLLHEAEEELAANSDNKEEDKQRTDKFSKSNGEHSDN